MNGKYKLAIKLATGLLLSMQAILVEAQEPGQDRHYLMGSGVPGSAPYNIGIGLTSLAQIILRPEQNLNLSSEATDSYHHSLQKIVDGTSQFAIVDSVSAHQASAGSGDQLTVVATLWHEVDHFIIANEYVQSGTISDLAILRRENFGTNLGNFEATRDLLGRFGVHIDDEAWPASVDWEAQRDSFYRGTISGLATTGPVPSTAVQEMLQQLDGRAQLLEFSNWQMAQIGGGWHAHSLTEEDYPGLTTQVDTVARTLMLVAHSDVPEEAVYQIVRMMFDNLPYLIKLEEAAARISLDYALQEVVLPFHPGAMRYYEEIGVLAEGISDPGAGQHDAAIGHTGHAGQGRAKVTTPPDHVHDEAMLSRARAEVHDGDVVLKIGRPPVLRHPETDIFTVYFGMGKTDLTGEDLVKIREITRHIMATYETYDKEPEVYVEGHTDSSGSWETNYEIAHRRARSVIDLLLAEGLPESWIHISDYSEEGLAIPTADGVAEERNRRTEITVIPQE